MQWTPNARPQEQRRPYRDVLDALQERVRPFIERQPEFARPAYGSVLQSGADMLPGVGDVVGVEDLQAAARDGDPVGIGLGLLAAIPGIPAIGRGSRGARRGLMTGAREAAPSGGLMTDAESALARYRAVNPDDTGARVLNPGDEGYPTNAQWDEASQAYVAPRADVAPARAARPERAPSLRPAMKGTDGKIYTADDNHFTAMASMPEDVRRRVGLNDSYRGFVDDRGRYLNRVRAQEYALNFGLLRDDAPSWARNNHELVSEYLRPYEPPAPVPPVEPDYPIRAYHGSPHSFDRFSLDKIGTGEGAQAYGHGLYFAGNEDVARQYRNNLTRDVQYRADGSVWNPQNELQHLNVRAAANQNGDDLAATLERAYEAALRAEPGGQAARAAEADIAHLEAIRDSGGLLPNRMTVNGRPLDDIYRTYELRADSGSFPEAQADYDRLALLEQLQIDGDPYDILGSRREDYSPEALDWFEREIVPGFKRPGSMYEVGINAHPDTFLDWDRPMAEQPESVRAALEDVLANVPGVRDNLQPYEIDTGPSNGSNLMGAFSEARPGDYRTAMTDELRQRGVNGIRYLDGNSRGAGEGSSNYVVFNDELVKILRKYGISGLGLTGGAALGGGLLGSPQDQQAQPTTF